MGRKAIVFLMAAFVSANLLVWAEGDGSKSTKPLPKKTLDEIEARSNVTDTLNDLRKLILKASRRKYMDCLKAFGSEPFCTCLREKSPIGIDFADYIRVVTSTKDELKYTDLNEESKRLVDATLEAREKCVAGK